MYRISQLPNVFMGIFCHTPRICHLFFKILSVGVFIIESDLFDNILLFENTAAINVISLLCILLF